MTIDPKQFERVAIRLNDEFSRKANAARRAKIEHPKPTMLELKEFYESHTVSIRAAIAIWKGEMPLPNIEGEAESFFLARIAAAMMFLQLPYTAIGTVAGTNPIACLGTDEQLIRWLLTNWFEEQGALFLYAYDLAFERIQRPDQ